MLFKFNLAPASAMGFVQSVCTAAEKTEDAGIGEGARESKNLIHQMFSTKQFPVFFRRHKHPIVVHLQHDKVPEISFINII